MMQIHSISAELEPCRSETVTRLPPPRLRPYVAGYAGFRAGPSDDPRRRLLPLNLTTLIIDFAGPGWLVTGPRCTTVIHDRPGWRHGVTVGLTPAGVRALLGMPMRESAGAIAPLDDVLGLRAAHLADRLGAAPDWATRFALLDGTLSASLESYGSPARRGTESLVSRAWWRLQTSGGRITIGALAGELGISLRHLENGFREHIGLPPKTVARIARFQHAVRSLSAPSATLATAVACGYADQAHLSREVRAMAGVTPARLFAFVQDSLHRPD